MYNDEYACKDNTNFANCEMFSQLFFANRKIMTKKERLEAIIAHYSDGKPSVFAKLIGVAPSTISSWLSRDTIDYDLLFAKCENLSSDWLLTGEGKMLRQEDKGEVNHQNDAPPDSALIEHLLDKIAAQAEEIGRLKQLVSQLERRRGDNAGHAQSSDIANVG